MTTREPAGPVGPVTLDHVAHLSGVSRATASRALNDRSGVRPEVRDRVRRIADSLGFVANRAARSLAGGRSSVIGLVLPSPSLEADPFGASLIHAVGRAAARAGQGLMLHLASEQPPRSVQHVIGDGLVSGLLISAKAVGEPWAEDLVDGAVPTVVLGRHPTRLDIESVSVENVESSATAVEHLFAVGCRRIGTITGPAGLVDASERVAGYRLAHRRRQVRVDPQLIVVGDFTRQSGVWGAERLLARGIDGLFAANDMMGLGALAACAGAGVAVPEQVAVVGFDCSWLDELVRPRLSSVRQPIDALAELAVARLLARIDGAPAGGSLLVPAEFVPAESSARSPGVDHTQRAVQ